MSDRKDDPDLAPDATPAEDLLSEEERRAKQMEYFGGEADDDIDDFDPTGLDDGSDLSFTAPEDAEGDEGTVAKEEDDAEKQPEGVSEEAEEPEEGAAAEADAGEGADDDGAARADQEEAERSEKPQGIPKHRFDEVNERRKAAEDELARLKAEKQAEEEGEKEVFDFDAKEEEYMDLLLDGKTEEAKQIRREIRAAEKAEWQSETKQETRADIDAQDAADEVNALSKETEKMFPVFDGNHEDFDSNITSKMLAFYRGYLAGDEYDTMGDAFVAALADVVDLYDLTERYNVNLGDDPAPEPKPAAEPKKDPKKESLREQAHQPVTSNTGEGSADRGVAVPDIMEMSDEDMDRLSESQLAKLRGDFI
jgi:hypothetical protein